MFCTKCGKELGEDASFCGCCGYKLVKEESTQEISDKEEPVQKKKAGTGTKIAAGVMIVLLIMWIIGIIGNLVYGEYRGIKGTKQLAADVFWVFIIGAISLYLIEKVRK